MAYSDGASAEASGAVEAELDGVVSAADESQDSPLRPWGAGADPIEGARISEALPPAGDIRTLFSGLTVRRTDDGGLRIEAPAGNDRHPGRCSGRAGSGSERAVIGSFRDTIHPRRKGRA